MKDRYLFKAKRIDNGKWEEGYYEKKIKWHRICDEYVKTERHYICVNMVSSEDSYIDRIEVVPETLCQYTGLTDKNGNKIWENDVVLFEEEICTVSWSDKDAQFTIESEFVVEHFGNVWSADCEVYGNIFDNPELVKGGM